MLHLRTLTLPAGASLVRRHALAAVAAPLPSCWPAFPAAAAAAPAAHQFRLFRRCNSTRSNSSSSRDDGPTMIPYNPDPLHVLQQAAGGAHVTSEAKDGLPDLYQLPADEDPAVTAARVLVREDLHREKQRKEIIEHFSIVLGGLALLAAYAVYVYQTEGRMIVANPFTTIIPKIPVHLPPIDPAAEDGPLWSALSAAMPQLKPVPELEEQWKKARKEKRKQLRLEKEAEILHWGGYIKEKPKKEKKKKEQQAEQQAEQTEQQAEQQKQ